MRGLTGSRSYGVADAFAFSQLFLAFPCFSLRFNAFLWGVGLGRGAGRMAYGAWSDGW